MTTIAYNHKDKEIAIDSRFTRNDIISTDSGIKVIKKDGVTFACAGSSHEYHKLVEMWFSEDAKLKPDCIALVVFNGDVYNFGLDCDGCILKEKLDESLADGSGGVWAMAAMDFGCSARDAVKYAKTKDIYTGGKIRVIKVK